MDRDTFIIFVYCLVVEHYWALTLTRALRHGGFEPGLTDQEVITMDICGEYWKLHAETDLFDYFRDHYRHFFPRLGDRTLFARQAANLCWLKARLQQRLVHLSGQDRDPVQPIDTVPLPVCTDTRAGRDQCFAGAADFGHCAAKKFDYYGFKLGLRVSRCGMITAAPLLAARPHDVNHTGAPQSIEDTNACRQESVLAVISGQTHPDQPRLCRDGALQSSTTGDSEISQNRRR